MKNIKAIIFDLGGVILNINYENTIASFKKIGVKKSSSFYSKIKQVNLFNQIETGEISPMKFLLKLQKKTDHASIKQIETAWNSMLKNLPKKRIELLKNLKHNYSIFLLSNTNTIHISELKRKLGAKQYAKFYDLFDKVYYSHKIGCRKPQSEAFKIILDENKLLANEVLFVDDSLQHIEGAKKLGLKTYHLKEKEEISTIFPDIFL